MPVSTSLRKAHFGRQDRRSDERIICEGTAIIDVLAPQPRSNVQARILDVGTASLKLSLPFFLSPGALIRIHMTGSTANAEVRYCASDGDEYHAGVKVEEVVPKSA